MDGELFTGLAQGGFPVLVAAFLLIRLERELRALTTAIHELKMCQVCKLKEERMEERK